MSKHLDVSQSTIKRRLKESKPNKQEDEKVFCKICGKRIDIITIISRQRRVMGNEYADGYRCYNCDNATKELSKKEKEGKA